MTDTAEPRTHPDPAFHHPYCQFRREGDDCTCVEGREAASEPRPDLREALDGGCILCEPKRHPNGLRHSEAEFRAYEAGLSAALATTPPAPDCRDGHDMRLTTDFDGEPFRCSRCRATPPAPEPCEICGKPGHSVDACPAAEWGTLTPPAQPLPTDPSDD